MPFLGEQTGAPWVPELEIEYQINQIIPKGGVVKFAEFEKALFERLKIERTREDFDDISLATFRFIQHDYVVFGSEGVRRVR